MTLDDFLRALEGLIDDRETSDDPPGEGNFGCEECRACNHCRFCIGCDSCEDCTYCDECIDCTSATQSKRCVSCQKISYCEDSRDCKSSRYLTLCVSCTDCVHCLACVGLEGAEFYVLNEKRTRKEYFALLRQVQELMAGRMNGGWRPPSIGLASDIVDPVVAGRDAELTAAPWLEDGRDADPPDEEPEREVRRATRSHDDWSVRDEYGRSPSAREDRGRDEYSRDEYSRDEYSRDEYSRDRGRGYPDDSELPPRPGDRADPRRARDPRRDDLPPPYGGPSMSSPPLPEPRDPAARDWIRDPPEYGSSYGEREDERTRPHTREAPSRPRSRVDFGGDLGRELDEDWDRDLGRDVGHVRGREPPRSREPERTRELERGSESSRGREPSRDQGRGDHGWDSSVERERYDRGYDDRGHERDGDHDVPRRQEQQPTQPFTRQRERDPYVDPRASEYSGRGRDDHFSPPVGRDSQFDEPESRSEDSPSARDRDASSPWLDEDQAQARRLAKRGSLRRAGRPARPNEAGGGRDATGSGSGSGSTPERSDGTHTSTGLRLGRKPKRR
jgi:hypothetical protein